jgi:hypothetical protein
MALVARIQIPILNSPLLWVNCPVLHDVSLTPPLAILEPTSLISYTYVIHE